MKKLFLPCIAALAILTFNSCSEKFKIAAPYKDVTVVYGFLDMNDTAHYIRIQKGFLDENQSALTMAKTADSSFYSNLSVRIERYLMSTNGSNVVTYTYSDSFHIDRVDLTAEGYPKQPGAFFDAPNYAYKFTDVLNPMYLYRLKITNLKTGRVDSADSRVISENPTNGFFVTPIDDNAQNLAGMSFFSTASYAYYTLDGAYRTPADQSNPIGVVQAIITFNWDDSDITTGARTHRSYDYDAGYLPINTGNGFVYSIPNISLYNGLSLGMGTAPSNIRRLIDRCDITVYASTHDYLQYHNALEAQGTGLTGSDIAPVFTNVKGENAIGLFTAKAKHTGKITITDRTIDSLFISPILAKAKIAGKAY